MSDLSQRAREAAALYHYTPLHDLLIDLAAALDRAERQATAADLAGRVGWVYYRKMRAERDRLRAVRRRAIQRALARRRMHRRG